MLFGDKINERSDLSGDTTEDISGKKKKKRLNQSYNLQKPPDSTKEPVINGSFLKKQTSKLDETSIESAKEQLSDVQDSSEGSFIQKKKPTPAQPPSRFNCGNCIGFFAKLGLSSAAGAGGFAAGYYAAGYGMVGFACNPIILGGALGVLVFGAMLYYLLKKPTEPDDELPPLEERQVGRLPHEEREEQRVTVGHH